MIVKAQTVICACAGAVLSVGMARCEGQFNSLLEEAAKNGGRVDTFIQFVPFSFENDSANAVGKEGAMLAYSTNAASSLSPYYGVQEFCPRDSLSASAAVSDQQRLAKGSRRRAIMEKLKRHAAKSQSELIGQLQEQGYVVESFWMDNSLFIKEAPIHLLALLVQMASKTLVAVGDDTSSLDPSTIISMSSNRVITRIPPIKALMATSGKGSPSLSESLHNLEDIPWNLRMINADKAWAHARGENVVIASIDTGIDFMHPQVYNQYRGLDQKARTVSHDYNWFDPEGLASIPTDAHGHGSHTMGSMVGENIGVAPGATWIAAQGCDPSGCTQHRLLSSAQWVLCPTDREGLNPECDLGADVVNNSWGGDAGDDASMTWFSASVEAWLAAGIVPIFAQGNSGPECATAGTPGDLTSVVGVGSVNQFGGLSVFSSRGPGAMRLGHAEFKPDYVAPGEAIISCKVGGGLITMSGTSMAAPHMAGVFAILLSANPILKFEHLRDIVTRTANTIALKEPQAGENICNGKTWNAFPNYHFGYGLVDVEAAVKEVLKAR